MALISCVETSVDIHTRCVVVATLHIIRDASDFLLHLVVSLAHETLDAEDSVLRVGDSLTLGGVSHLPFAVFHECDDGRSGALAFAVGDHSGLVALKNGYATVGGTQVDSNNLSHILINLKLYK